MFAGWGCIGLFAVTLLVTFMLFRAAFNILDDPTGGMVVREPNDTPSPDVSRRAQAQTEEEDPTEDRPSEPTSSADWPTDFEDVAGRAREDQRPLVVIFTAEYSSQSRDLLEGVFSRPRVAHLLDTGFERLHVDMDIVDNEEVGEDQPEDGSPTGRALVAACSVEFLPCVCYLHPETHEPLIPNNTHLLSVDEALTHLRAASRAYSNN